MKVQLIKMIEHVYDQRDRTQRRVTHNRTGFKYARGLGLSPRQCFCLTSRVKWTVTKLDNA